MKVFIPLKADNKSFNYEGTRLRKSIKGCLEEVGIEWTSDEEEAESADICHFLSPKRAALAEKLKNKGKTIISFALYAELDPLYRYLTNEKTLTTNGKKLLEASNLVLVPSLTAKQEIDSFKLNVVTAVLPMMVNLKRFEKSLPESTIFPRYNNLKKNDFYSIAIGDYAQKVHIDTMIELASLCPSIRFYFIGANKKRLPLWAKKGNIRSKTCPNLYFQPLIEDDVYRSALLNCSCYILLPSDRCSSQPIVEAIACKVPVIGFARSSGYLDEEELGYGKFFYTAEEAGMYLRKLYKGETKTSIIQSSTLSANRSLASSGERLKKIYEAVLGEKL